jgi:malate dehydrogenase (oxaloacetate-decarboxylating)
MDKDDRLVKANKPAEDALRLHPFYRGKIEVVPKCAVRSIADFAIWYTPGVAAPCKAIEKNPELVYEYTNKWNTVAVISDGTRVLGLGDIGPLAGLPVMEGKALIFKYLGGVDAFPLTLDTKDPELLITIVKALQPALGGVNLEDISQPKCFRILDQLRQEMTIPVWHDDQQGTAAVTLAGLLNALKIVGKKMNDIRLTLVGTGAAGLATFRILLAAGLKPEQAVLVDEHGILGPWMEELGEGNPTLYHSLQGTNPDHLAGGIEEAMRGADVVIAYSKPGPDTIKPAWIGTMGKDPVLFACANPVPEIWPWDAQEAGARIVATGRSDFPNQVNNSLGFPGIFRGALDVRARTISDEMCIAAAEALARAAEKDGLREDRLIPTMDDWEVFVEEAVAVGRKAIEQGLARLQPSEEELREEAGRIIRRARKETEVLTREGIILLPPEE